MADTGVGSTAHALCRLLLRVWCIPVAAPQRQSLASLRGPALLLLLLSLPVVFNAPICVRPLNTTGCEQESNEPPNMPDTDNFMYFGYGSNLLKERLQLANPSATFISKGRLKDYELDFGLWAKHVDNTWHGGVATINASPGAEVWGVIWTLSNDNLLTLDHQEGVKEGLYSPMEISVETEGGVVLCRTYKMNNFHACPPSPQYKQVLCLGAEQNGLPDEYRKRLEVIPTNNYSGPSILDQIKAAPK